MFIDDSKDIVNLIKSEMDKEVLTYFLACPENAMIELERYLVY